MYSCSTPAICQGTVHEARKVPHSDVMAPQATTRLYLQRSVAAEWLDRALQGVACGDATVT